MSSKIVKSDVLIIHGAYGYPEEINKIGKT